MTFLLTLMTLVATADAVKGVNSSTTEMTTGTYRAKASYTISSRITITGEVTLIIDNGQTLTASNGIYVKEGATLTIEGPGNSKLMLPLPIIVPASEEKRKKQVEPSSSMEEMLQPEVERMPQALEEAKEERVEPSPSMEELLLPKVDREAQASEEDLLVRVEPSPLMEESLLPQVDFTPQVSEEAEQERVGKSLSKVER